MKGYIKEYREWRFIFEDEGDPTEGEATVSTFMLNLLNNPATKKSLIGLLNRALTDQVKTVPTQKESFSGKIDSKTKVSGVSLGEIDFGDFNLYWVPTSGKVTKIDPTPTGTEGEVSNKGSVNIFVNIFMRLKNETIDPFTIGQKGFTTGVGIDASATYLVNEEDDTLYYKINSMKVRPKKIIIDESKIQFMRLNPIQIVVTSDGLTVRDYKEGNEASENVYLDNMKFNLMDLLSNKSGTVDIKELK